MHSGKSLIPSNPETDEDSFLSDAKRTMPNSLPPKQPEDDSMVTDLSYEQKAFTEGQNSQHLRRRNNLLACKDINFDQYENFAHDEHFHEHVLKYNNNKLYWPNICDMHKGEGYKFRKFPGEVIMVELKTSLNVMSIDENLSVQAILTNYRLLFLPEEPKYLMLHHLRSDYFSIPLMIISNFRKFGEKKNNLSNLLEIHTKCGRKFKLNFSFEDTSGGLRFVEVLENLVPPPKIFNCFAFAFHSKFPEYEEKYKGWTLYDMNREYTRQGVLLLPANATKEDVANARNSSHLIPFKMFQNFQIEKSEWICDTYPPEVVVPALVEIDEAVKCAKYRTKQRLPVLTFCYQNENRVATLWRSSQCKPGLSGNRSTEDEHYLRLMGGANGREFKEGMSNLHIYDARPFLNAMANKMHGKGFENVTYYKNTEIFFLDIDNIHGVRDRYKKLVELSASLNTEKLTSSLDYSGWVDSLAYILAGAKMIVEKSLKQGINALIHCSDGWDRTTQLNSLVQIMLDPYFRTIEGFQVLIEKDWVSFGHMFKSRGGWKSNGAFDEDKRSPVFIQFLDCVHQLQNQFPAEFEYNGRFVTDIAYYSRTGLFGTFLSDNYHEMTKNNIPENTTSIWSFINAYKEMYKCSLYKALTEHATFFKREIVPDTSLINMRFWREFFCFYARNALEEGIGNIELDSKNDLYEITLALQMKKNDLLNHENSILYERIKELSAELAKSNLRKNSTSVENKSSDVNTIHGPGYISDEYVSKANV